MFKVGLEPLLGVRRADPRRCSRNAAPTVSSTRSCTISRARSPPRRGRSSAWRAHHQRSRARGRRDDGGRGRGCRRARRRARDPGARHLRRHDPHEHRARGVRASSDSSVAPARTSSGSPRSRATRAAPASSAARTRCTTSRSSSAPSSPRSFRASARAGRPLGDQKRAASPREAVIAGADYIVVGRPITDAADPVAVAQAVIAEIAR